MTTGKGTILQQQSHSQNRYYVLFLLTIVYAFNFVDRQVVGILAPFIQADLKLSDGQIGLLSGIYFAAFYTILGIPIALLADRVNRVSIVSLALATWSGFTALSGLAGNFTALALARMGVGVGEAGGSPPSHSMISDLFPKEQRGKALAIYSLGIPFGIMLAYFASAFLLGRPEFNWRTVFIALGIPGILFAILLKLTVKEPTRGAMDQELAATQKIPLTHALSRLLKIPSWWGMCFGISFASFGGYALSAFLVIYIGRAFPEDVASIGISKLLIILGLINGIAYAAGVFLGGVLADWRGAKNKGGYAMVPAIGLLLGVPCLLASFVTGHLTVSLMLLTAYLFLSGFFIGPSFSVAQSLAPISVRAMSTALFFFILNMIAMGGGPTYIGFMSDWLTQDYGPIIGLRYALLSLAVPYGISILAFLWTSTRLQRDWDQAQAS